MRRKGLIDRTLLCVHGAVVAVWTGVVGLSCNSGDGSCRCGHHHGVVVSGDSVHRTIEIVEKCRVRVGGGGQHRLTVGLVVGTAVQVHHAALVLTLSLSLPVSVESTERYPGEREIIS